VEAVLTRFIWFIPVLALGATARPLAAQDVRDLPPQAPVTFTPPAGLCRVWLNGVPASQQPAPTDCASAIRNRPSNAAVVFGPKRRSESSELESFARRAGFPTTRQITPSALVPRRRDDTREPGDARDRAVARDRGDVKSVAPDAPAKAVRKPEKPQ
jgi:hypothetical protein